MQAVIFIKPQIASAGIKRQIQIDMVVFETKLLVFACLYNCGIILFTLLKHTINRGRTAKSGNRPGRFRFLNGRTCQKTNHNDTLYK